MPNGFASGQTTIQDNSRANTRVHTTLIRTAYSPEPPPKPRFAWGLKSLGRGGKPGITKRKTIKPVRDEIDEIPVRAVTTFQIKTPVTPVERDGVTRLTARVTPNGEQMYSASEYVGGGGGEAGRGDEHPEEFKPLRFGERMMRNTAVCVAILLCALAIRTVDAPIARTVSAELREWVTMDLDESLGSLKFVQNLLPDAALVFWHIGARQTFAPPSQAALSHSWNENEPYLAYGSGTQNPVFAAAAGEVAAITYLDDTTATVRLRHEDGMETVYGNLASCTVREGDMAAVGDIIGASGTLYFEIRGEGRSMNPAPLMAANQP